jgi:hypothetical protein
MEKFSPEREVPKNTIWEVNSEVWNTYDEEMLAEYVIALLQEQGIDTSKVMFAGFDGKSGVNDAVSEPRGHTYAVTIIEWDNEIQSGSTGYNPITDLTMAQTPCLSVYDMPQLNGRAQELAERSDPRTPVFHKSGGDVQQARIGTFVFKK